MKRTESLVLTTLAFLANGPSPTLQASYLKALALALRGAPFFNTYDAHLSFDLINTSHRTWRIAASTDGEAPIDSTYTYDDGLTGWAAKSNRRTPLYVPDRNSLPHGARILTYYEKTTAAYLHFFFGQRGLTGCLCLTSEYPIAKAAIGEVQKIGGILAALMTGSGANRPLNTGSLQQWPPPLTADPKVIQEWIRERIDEVGYQWVDYWEWNAQAQILTPQPLSRTLRENYSGWLHPLKLGEGFVGRAAKSLTPVREDNIEDGVGKVTGYVTPLALIQPTVPLRALLAYPVHDDARLFGVLAFLGETRDHFSSADQATCSEIANEYASLLHEVTERQLALLQRHIKENLFNALLKPDTPSEYWERLSGVLQLVETNHLGTVAYFFVSKRFNRTVMSCKAASQSGTPTRGLSIDSTVSPEMRLITSLTNGIYPIKKLTGTPSLARLEEMGADAFWIDSFRSLPYEDEPPELLAAVALLPREPHSPGFGRRNPANVLEAIFTSIFTTTRAVLNSADSQRLAAERERMMLAGTHELRSPINSIRTKIEALKGLDAEASEYQQEALAELEGLMLRVDNILYPGSKELSQREEVDVRFFLDRQAEAIRRANPHQILTIDSKRLDSVGSFFLYISPHWVEVAFQNVLSNAVKFGKDAPVSLAVRDLDRPEPEALPRPYNCILRFTIEDRGIGIPKGEIDKIFVAGHLNPHSRDYNVLGSQIGLSITRDIVDEHGGKIWAQSTVNDGSKFYIELPGIRRSRH